jgi:glycosyltransferase involved in cell wall biosynthesis
MHEVVLTMPVYNEAEGIEIFLEEIFLAFANRIEIVVCDDNSTDDTYSILKSISERKQNLHITQNRTNLGHGATFLNALKMGLEITKSEHLITCDGDGQFSGHTIYRIYHECKVKNIQVLEGVRISRSDGPLRATISFFTRALVGILTRDFPRDANTPLRVYQRDGIVTLFGLIPKPSLVPNLWFSIIVRTRNHEFEQSAAESRPRLGENKSGSTWQGMSRFRKLNRLIRFCRNATWEILSNIPKLTVNKD